ncbi:hypothetical protein PV325_013241 [Microctonus aethiopoides]|nr:hypothetical protein PV325_013241 [Microctonus aethiopoides]
MVYVSYSLLTVLVSFDVLQSALTDNIENPNSTSNYDPEKLIGTWYVMNMVGPNIFMPPTCIHLQVTKRENNVFYFSFGDSESNDNEHWTAKIENSEIFKIPSNSNERNPDFRILDHPNENEIVLQNRRSSVYLMMNRKRNQMSMELYRKYRKISDDNNYVYREIEQSNC